jgi:hypothetical protein
MIKRLPEPDEKQQPDPRSDLLDGPLQVASWSLPAGDKREYVDLPEGAPSWWQGEEAASQEFFRAMGINPETVGK